MRKRERCITPARRKKRVRASAVVEEHAAGGPTRRVGRRGGHGGRGRVFIPRVEWFPELDSLSMGRGDVELGQKRHKIKIAGGRLAGRAE